MAPAQSIIKASLLRVSAPILVYLVLCATGSAWAAPPPGHPTPDQAREILMPNTPPSMKDLPLEGKVLNTLDANEFTYIEVSQADQVGWLAAPLIAIKPGSTIRFEEGTMMSNFFSKLLKRTFASVRFVGHVLVVTEP